MKQSDIQTLQLSDTPGLTALILLLVILLSLATTSSARQSRGSSPTQQQQPAPLCPMHQTEQSATCPMLQGSQQGKSGNREQHETQAQGQGQNPQHQDSHQGHDAMNQRGNAGMGFDQKKTTHHFRLLAQGGAIEVEANDAIDTSSRDQIRSHLAHIADMFKGGDFSIPMFVHDETPPGVERMKELKGAIRYEYQETTQGGRVKIETADSKALEAIHAFLRFQIREHNTGDSIEVSKP